VVIKIWLISFEKIQNTMNKKIVIIIFILSLTLASYYQTKSYNAKQKAEIIYYTVNPQIQQLQFFWKNDSGNIIGNFANLKAWLESKNTELVFAVNGGMFNKDQSPQGLYIENGKVLAKADTLQAGYGNFYLQPNGIFYVTDDNGAVVCKTADFTYTHNIKFATQSGPMLLIDSKIHPAFTQGSKNLYIRNGVGILPNGNILFAMSKQKINFYDFATFFKSMGCKNALYLDGFVSRIYLPSKNMMQTDGNLGVMIAEIKSQSK